MKAVQKSIFLRNLWIERYRYSLELGEKRRRFSKPEKWIEKRIITSWKKGRNIYKKNYKIKFKFWYKQTKSWIKKMVKKTTLL